MKRLQRTLPLHALLVVLLLGGLAGCSDDDNPTSTNNNGGGGGDYGTGLVGTWVAYQGMKNGLVEFDSGTWITLRADGTGTGYAITERDYEDVFTWTADENVITAVSPDWGTSIAGYALSGDALTITVDEGGTPYHTFYQRYRGASVLTGTWGFVSVYDSYTEEYQPEDYHTVQFGTSGQFVVAYEGRDPSPGTFTTDGVVVSINGSVDMVFAVVGDVLYLTQSHTVTMGPDYEQNFAFVLKYEKL